MRSTPHTRFLGCIPLEGAVTALGYFQASMAVAGILFILRQVVLHPYNAIPFDYTSRHEYLFVAILVLGLYLTLAVLLLVGIMKRRPGFVLTYLVVGVLRLLSATVYWLVRMFSDSHISFVYDSGVEAVLTFFLESLFLVMVYLVYRNIILEKIPITTNIPTT